MEKLQDNIVMIDKKQDNHGMEKYIPNMIVLFFSNNALIKKKWGRIKSIYSQQ